MNRHASLLNTPLLPYDVLRLIFEEATKDDTRKAVAYTVISKLVRGWVEICLYENVQLYREKTLRKFVRTLETSTKPPHFFATRVKSLSITYNVLDVNRISKIISICRGVQSLSIWSVPTKMMSSADMTTTHVSRVGDSHAHRFLASHLFHILPDSSSPYQDPKAFATYLNALIELRPKHLSLQLHSPLKFLINNLLMKWHNECHTGITLSTHNLFADVTHLSIVDSWQEWCSWTWEPILWNFKYHDFDFSSPFLSPHLTHLSFDIQVGKGHDDNTRSGFCQRMGRTLAHILSNPYLQCLHALVCILSFDDDPLTTVRMIRSELESYLPLHGNTTTPTSPSSEPSGNPTLLERKDVSAKTYLRGSTQTAFSTMMMHMHNRGWISSVYPKLVFTYDPEPFKDREANSEKMKVMWKRADELVHLRRRTGQVAKTAEESCMGESEQVWGDGCGIYKGSLYFI